MYEDKGVPHKQSEIYRFLMASVREKGNLITYLDTSTALVQVICNTQYYDTINCLSHIRIDP